MRIFKKVGHQQPTKLEKRVSGISTPDLVGWAENALFILGREITSWLRDNDQRKMDEAVLGAEVLLAITKELQRRSREY